MNQTNLIKEIEIMICWAITLGLPVIGIISVVTYYTTNPTNYRPPTQMETWLGLVTASLYAWLMFRNYLTLRQPKMIEVN